VQNLLALVQVLDELGDAARESKLGRFIAALIGERDFQALVEKRKLAQALRQNVVAVFVVSKIEGSGWKVILVPVLRVLPVTLILPFGFPIS